MKVLFVSNLFPDTREETRGFVNARLIHFLSRHCEIRVVSPRPTLPFVAAVNGRPYAPLPADVPFEPAYPPVYYVPKLGSYLNHRLMAAGLRMRLHELRARFDYDVILGAWIYPDGCAAAQLADEMNLPCVLIAQGSDVHEYLLMPTRRRIIAAHLQSVSAVITRSRELARLLEAAPVDKAKMRVIYNGVDFDLFKPADKTAARQELGLPANEFLVLYVGGFFSIKNPELAVASHAALSRQMADRKTRLIMIGTGTMWSQIRRETRAAGRLEQVIMPGQKSPAEVARYMQAADVLCVPSDNEGVPNVIYEAFSCGLKVVATNVGGIPEVLSQDFLGHLTERGNVSEMTKALARVAEEKENAPQIIAYARQFSWEKTAEAYHRVLLDAVHDFAKSPAA